MSGAREENHGARFERMVRAIQDHAGETTWSADEIPERVACLERIYESMRRVEKLRLARICVGPAERKPSLALDLSPAGGGRDRIFVCIAGGPGASLKFAGKLEWPLDQLVGRHDHDVRRAAQTRALRDAVTSVTGKDPHRVKINMPLDHKVRASIPMLCAAVEQFCWQMRMD